MRKLWKPDKDILMYALLLFIAATVGLSLSATFFFQYKRSSWLITLNAIAAGIVAIYIIYGYLRIALRYIKRLKRRGSLIRQYIEEPDVRYIVNYSGSAAYGILFGLYEYSLTFVEHSYFFLAVSVVYILIGMTKIYLITRYYRIKQHQVNIYRVLAIFFFIISIAVMGITVLVYHHEGGFRHRALVLYVLAGYSVFTLFTTTYSTVKSKQNDNLAMLSLLRVKHVNLLYTIFTLTVSIQAAFFSDFEKQQEMNLFVGCVVSALILLYAGYMVYKIVKLKKKTQ